MCVLHIHVQIYVGIYIYIYHRYVCERHMCYKILGMSEPGHRMPGSCPGGLVPTLTPLTSKVRSQMRWKSWALARARKKYDPQVEINWV